MAERPTLFKGEMVRAILEDRKNHTRRLEGLDVINKEPDAWEFHRVQDGYPDGRPRFVFHHQGDGEPIGLVCPKGEPGDRLWVKETWMPFDVGGSDYLDPVAVIGYRASNDIRPNGVGHEEFGASREFPCPPEDWRKFKLEIERMEVEGERWKPSIFMPRWASRILLEITGVRVERLNEISEADAIAEGIERNEPLAPLNWSREEFGWLPYCHHHPQPCDCFPAFTARESYAGLWESINGPGSWEKNPYVWVIEFKRLQPAPTGALGT